MNAYDIDFNVLITSKLSNSHKLITQNKLECGLVGVYEYLHIIFYLSSYFVLNYNKFKFADVLDYLWYSQIWEHANSTITALSNPIKYKI